MQVLYSFAKAMINWTDFFECPSNRISEGDDLNAPMTHGLRLLGILDGEQAS